MGGHGRAPPAITVPRRTDGLEFGPIRIDLRLKVDRIPKLLIDERPFIERAMAPFDPAVALRGMARNPQRLDAQADPP